MNLPVPSGRVWIGDGSGGGLVDAAEARIAYDDHGVTVGDGVFETLKLDRGVPFARTRHLRRLATSAEVMGIALPPADQVDAAIDAVCAHAPGDDGYLRITVTAGPGPLGSNRADVTPTLIVAIRPGAVRVDPTEALVVPWTRNERGALTGVKSTSYGENVRALAVAEAAGASEALFANTVGQLCEGTGSNVFVALDGGLMTPTLGSGCLAGVTRELLLEAGVGVEADLGIDDLRRASEVFLASTGREVQPVSAIHWHEELGGGTTALPQVPGPLTAEARQVWLDRIATQLDP